MQSGSVHDGLNDTPLQILGQRIHARDGAANKAMCFADDCWCLSADRDRHRSSIRESLRGGFSVVPAWFQWPVSNVGARSVALQSITDV